MFKFPLASDDTFLILAPRWADHGAAWQISLLALTLAFPLVMILWLYRYELRLISRLASCGLLILRLLILLVIWAAIAWQPHVVEVHVEETTGRVRIAVDLSSSMDVVDTQRTAAERTALARALRLPAGDDLTRKQIVGRLLSPDGLNLLQRIDSRHEIEIVGFHQNAMEMQPAHLLETLADKRNNPLTFATDLRQPLSASTKPLLGILLFSDGQHNVKAPPFDLANDLGKQRTPIFPVVIGARAPPHDLAILDVQAKTEAFKDTTVPVEIRCKVTNMPVQDMTVEMKIDGKPARPEHRETIKHHGKDDGYTVRFQVKMDEVGTHTLSIKATSTKQKEVTLANNVAERVIRVTDDKARILLVDGEARWEYQYVANALRRDPQINLDRVVFGQPRIGALKDADLDKAGLPKTKLPEPKPERADHDPLLDYDCIMLGDVAPEDLPIADRKRIERFVSERGGTLILMAGKRHLPMAYLKANLAGDDPLVKMLPITQVRELPREASFTLRLTAEGKLQKYLNLESEGGTNAWPDLPKHFWGVIGKRRQVASVLAAPVLDPPSKEDPDTGIILQQNYGFGRVLFVGLDSTWRWRFRVGDTYHHRFWGQLARWSAAESLLPAGNRWIRYGPRQPVYYEGQETELAVRLHELLPPLKDLSSARVLLHRKNADRTESLIATIPLARHPRQPNLLVAAVRESAGTYRMEVDIPQYRVQLAEPSEAKDTGKDRDVFRILARPQLELLDLATNWPIMQGLADRSGGTLYTPENVEDILERLAQRIERSEERRESRPWQEEPMVWWMLGILLGLLTVEWAWRKWLDLP